MKSGGVMEANVPVVARETDWSLITLSHFLAEVATQPGTSNYYVSVAIEAKAMLFNFDKRLTKALHSNSLGLGSRL